MALMLVMLPLLLFGITSGFTPSSFTLPYVGLVILVQVFTSGLGEEPGWRGFLLPRLQASADFSDERKETL